MYRCLNSILMEYLLSESEWGSHVMSGDFFNHNTPYRLAVVRGSASPRTVRGLSDTGVTTAYVMFAFGVQRTNVL